MGIRSVLVFLCVSFLSAKAHIRPQRELSVVNGQGFVAYLEVPKSFGKVSRCSFRFREQDFVEVAPIKTERGELVNPFSSDKCGIRVSEVSTASADDWSLEAANELGEKITDSIHIYILSSPKMNFDTSISKQSGDSYIPCTAFKTTRSCRIRNNNNEQSWGECPSPDVIRNQTSYECRTMNWGIMEESSETVLVSTKEEKQFATQEVFEDDERIVLTCAFEHSLTHCKAEMPDSKTQLLIMDGLYNGKYSTFETSVSTRRCSIEIPKPFSSADKGLWAIHHGEKTIQTGCLFYVGDSKTNIIKQQVGVKKEIEEIIVHDVEKEDMKISCKAPFALDYCYLKSPSNQIYFTDKWSFQLTKSVGVCQFSDLKASPGIWSCFAGGDEIIEQKFDVAVKSPLGEVEDEIVAAHNGDSVKLLCKSGKLKPILNCAFTNPEGEIYYVGRGDFKSNNFKKNSSKVEYFGKGLDEGNCGITVKSLTQEDFGQWTCQFNLHSNSTEISFKITIENDKVIGQAAALGAGIGVGIVALLILTTAGIVFYKRSMHSRSHPSRTELEFE